MGFQTLRQLLSCELQTLLSLGVMRCENSFDRATLQQMFVGDNKKNRNINSRYLSIVVFDESIK